MPGKIHVPVTVATDGFSKLQRTFSRLRGVTVGLTTAIAGLGAAARAIDFTGAAIQGARDLERNYAGLTSVFKDATDQMKEFGQTASDVGLSMNEAAKATTFIGSVLKQSGFSIEETANLTEELVELGADLALTYGYDVQEALLGMTALFRGEYDPIEKFGVAMKQSEIDAEKAARGLDHLTGAEERFADQQIRVEFLMERASDAMGAFERQSGNLTVQQMRLRAEFENVRDTIADDLLPPLAGFTGGVREIVQDVGPQLETTFDKLGVVISSVSDDVIDFIEFAVNFAIDAFDNLVEFLRRATNENSELGESFVNLFDSVSNLVTGLQEFLEPITDFVERHGPSFEEVVIGINNALADLIDFVERNKAGLTVLAGTFLAAKIRISATVAAAAAFKAVQKGLIGATLLSRLNLFSIAVGISMIAVETFSEETSKAKDKLKELNDELSRSEELEIFREALAEVEDETGVYTLGLQDARFEVENFNQWQLRATEGNEAYQKAIENLYKPMNSQAQLTADIRDRTLEAYLAQLNLNAALAEFKLIASTAVDTTTLEGVLEASRGRGMGGGKVGWDAEEYLKDLGLIPPDGSDDDITGTIQDFVGDFFGNVQEEIAKQEARLDLEALGLSKALIDQIVGSEGWQEIFDAIIDGGAEMARQLQMDFNQTAAGIAELEKAAKALEDQLKELRAEQASLEQQIIDTQEQRAQAIADATAKFNDYKNSIDVTVDALQTYEREIGRFESQTRSDLLRIENQIQNAFDNGYLLEEARDNLLAYARAELNTLMQLQRQRDELLQRRNAAAGVIFGIADAVAASGNITSLLRNVQDEVKEVQVKELFEDVVQSADGLNGFKVTVERNYTDVITNTVSKSKALVSGFQDVVNRTRAFIDNLKILREMGLDPFLFNQLVQAGAEAGGATAAALVEGGTDTVNEVNKLQSELESMGVELGEQTYEVTKNSGEQFVSGIIDGMDAELERLGEMAISMATGFTQTFEISFKAGMQAAFDGIIEGIRAEFQVLINQLQAELDALLARIARTEAQAADAAREARVARGESIIVDGVEVQEGSSSITPENVGDLPASEQAFLREAFPELFPGSNGGGTTVNNYTINTSNPLDASYAAKQTVQNQSNFQSANGNISVTLSGVGS